VRVWNIPALGIRKTPYGVFLVIYTTCREWKTGDNSVGMCIKDMYLKNEYG